MNTGLPSRPVLYGRARELVAIDRLVAAARAGRGGALAVWGEPGIGKSALLAYASQRAEGLRVLHAVGVEGESRLAYAALHQLLRPLLGQAERLPPPQAGALRVAFGLEAGESPDGFLVAVAALTLLSEHAEDRPLLCLVDDAHWADAPSLAALGFAARRLETEPVALLVALREGEGRTVDTAGMGELHVAGLDADAAAALLEERWAGRLAPPVRRRLLEEAGGNPLALLELPAALTPGQRAGTDSLEEPLPLAGTLERAFLDRVRRHDAHAQTLLLLAAAEGAGQLATIRRAAGQLGLDPAVLEAEQLTDLVRFDGSTVVFRHPLVRSAVYHGASATARAAAHRALAEALDDGEVARRAWHRAQATDGPDEAVACELECAAQLTLRRAGHAAAAIAMERAAELSVAGEDRARRLTAAAAASWRGGDTSGARALLDRAERLEPRQAAVDLELRHLRGSIELRVGIPADGARILAEVAGEAVAVDRLRAMPLLVAAADAAFLAGQWETLGELGNVAARLLPTRDAADGVVLRLLAAAAQPNGGGSAAATSSPNGSGNGTVDLSHAERLDDPMLIGLAGQLAWKVGGDEAARALHAKAVARSRMLGAVGTLAWALENLSLAELKRDRFALAEAYAREGLTMALEAGHRNGACRHKSLLAHLSALRGREEETRRLAEEVLAEATARRLVREASEARLALGLLALGAGRAAEALEHLEALWAAGPLPGYPPIALYATPDLVEAAVRAGEPERCRDQLDAFLAASEPRHGALEPALAARCRALVASGEEAEHHLEEALRLHALAQQPFDHARTELLYGEFLRRQRRRTQARPHLRNAVEAFQRLGTPAWAERARRELRAAGETARTHDPSTMEQLTPQELQIAHGVIEGATNREIAAQLFVSPRTVSHHLRSIFKKLGISSRAELIRLGHAGDGAGAPGHPLTP
jgi:DNA-binding NarL/FixJ family response regulator